MAGLVRHQIGRVDDGDGLELADVDGDGDVDLVVAESKRGVVSWFEQGDDLANWTKHFIAGGYSKIEGLEVVALPAPACLGVVVLDQSPGHVVLAVPTGTDVRGPWNATPLVTTAKHVQSALDADVDFDGDVDLVYAFEGNRAGTGGVEWVEFLGGDPLDATRWARHVMAQINGGWWLVERRLDVDGDGNATDVVVSARELRNPAADPGIYQLTPTGNLSAPWRVRVIEDGTEYAPLHVTAGNFTGGTSRADLVAGAMDRGHGVYLYAHADNYSRTVLHADGRWHNVQGIDLDGRPTNRDELVLVDKEALWGYRIWLYQHVGAEYQRRWSDYYWKADDRIIPVDLTGDGINEVVTVSAMDNSVDWWEVRWGENPWAGLVLPRWWVFAAIGVLALVGVGVVVMIWRRRAHSRSRENHDRRGSRVVLERLL